MKRLTIAGLILVPLAVPFVFLTLNQYSAYFESQRAHEQQVIRCESNAADCWGLGRHHWNAESYFQSMMQYLIITMSLSASGSIILVKNIQDLKSIE